MTHPKQEIVCRQEKKKGREKDNVLVGPWNNLQDMHVKKQDSEHCVVQATICAKWAAQRESVDE